MVKNTTYLILFSMIFSLFWSACFGQNMKDHLWKNRILLIKTDNIKAKKYTTQFKELLNLDEQLKERKLIVYAIHGTHFSAVDYVTNTKESGSISGEAKGQLFQIDAHFELILIGLDGRIKLQQNEVISAKNLFAIIDAMPMRKYKQQD